MELKITDKIIAGRAVLVGVDSFGMAEEADCIENAVMSVLLDGLCTGDIKGKDETSISCSQMGDEICRRI